MDDSLYRDPSRFLAGLNEAQAQAVSHRGSPLLVVAGPGSGKTRVLTHRIASRIDEGLDPSRLLAVTFTNKAAAEMRHRLAALLGEDQVPHAVSTFHACCVRLLRNHATEAGLPRGFTILDVSDAERALMGTDDSIQRKEARAILSKISYAKNTLADRDALRESSTKQDRVLAAHWDAYERRLAEMGALDFDDLLVRTRDLLLRTPADAPLRTRFTSILVDEWQDTNEVQYDIVRLLAGANPAQRDVCVVGDAEQAIYGWRGSTPAVVDRFVTDFAPCTVVQLGQNYRSTPEIVAATAAVAAASTVANKVRLHTDAASGEPVRVIETQDPDHEVALVVAQLRRRSGTRAVLVRTNAQTRGFETALNAAGIAHQLVGMTRFTDRLEVKDALAYLRLVMNPADEVAFARVANTPRRAFGDVSLTTFLTAARAQGSTPVAALYDEALLAALPRRVSAAAAKFAAMLDLVRAGATTGPVAACHAVLDAGLRECYRTDQERLENLDELLVFAESFTAQRSTEDPTLGPNELLEGFLEAAALASSTDVDERAPVSVITAHASKGREFDHVWVVGVEESVFPHQMSFPDGVEEERRLCFVALSRARSTLTVTYRRRHFLNGEWHDADRSRFLDLLGDTAVFSEEFPPNRPRLGGRSYPSHRPAPPSDRPVWRPEPARTPVARPQGPRLDVAQVHPGLSVHHNVFGTGTVESIAGSMAQIRFGAKTRTLDLNFAPLTTTPT